MCGFSLAIDQSGQKVNKGLIHDMNNKIIHRGPDDEGIYIYNNVGIGHRRLSIIDLSALGHQPMSFDNLTIAYNGEIYNYIELQEELIKEGYNFTSQSDTEVVLKAYKHWGKEAFNKFNGMWALTIYDSIENNIILSRDRFGIKPIFYSKVNNIFFAGSEIKQFTSHKDFKPKLNKKIAINFLVYGWLNFSQDTFFQDVFELRGGHNLTYDLDTHNYSIEKWYHLENNLKKNIDSFEQAKQTVKQLLSDSIRLRMRSDVNVGSCLSGGIDSSAIVTMAQKLNLSNSNFATVTSCYKDINFNEERYSDTVTELTGYKAIKVFPDLDKMQSKDMLDFTVHAHDQPYSSASNYSQYEVFKASRTNNLVVMLDGQGADEYFCGYNDFFILYLKEKFSKFQFGKIYHALKKNMINNSWKTTIKQYVFKQIFHWFIWVYKNTFPSKRYPWLTAKGKKITNKHIVTFKKGRILHHSINQLINNNLPALLHSEDRNSMINSIESRLPFLDYRLVEYVLSLPTDYKIGNGYLKYILREAVDDLPLDIGTRKDKMGFVAPTGQWAKDNKEMMLNEFKEIVKTSDLIGENIIERFNRFLKGELGYEEVYFRIIALNKFCKAYNMNL